MMPTRWREAQNHYESLAVSLRAVLAHFDDDRPYHELLAVLGLGAATVAVADDSVGWWSSYARDARLVETARLYGLHLRELHPPEAALGLSRSAEYARHFRDSYAPLIRHALAHEQLVLAWRGWPGPRDRLWGVLTGVQDAKIVGHTLWHDGRPLPLTGPAHQAYIVEEFRRSTRDAATPTDLFTHTARLARVMWSGGWATSAAIKTGPAAYEAWKAAVQKPADNDASGLPLHRQHSQAVRVHVAARSYLATWLRQVAGGLAGGCLEIAAHWASVCDRVGERLLPQESPEVVKELLDQPAGVARLCRAIDDVCEVEAGLAELLESLA